MATAVDLPEEIWTKVFRYLEGPDLARAATVCKTWHRVALDDDVWRAELERRLRRANVPAEVTTAVLARTHQPLPGGSVREHFLRDTHPASLVAETALVPAGLREPPQPFGVAMAWPPREADRSPHGWVVAPDPDQPEEPVVHLPRRRGIWYLTFRYRFRAVLPGPLGIVWMLRLDEDASLAPVYTIVAVSSSAPDALEQSTTITAERLRQLGRQGWFYVIAEGFEVPVAGPLPASCYVEWRNTGSYQWGLWLKTVIGLSAPLLEGALPADRTLRVRLSEPSQRPPAE